MSEAERIGEGLPAVLALRIDEVCNRFESGWQAGQQPRIEDYLGEEKDPEYPVLLRELILLEVYYRRQVGEQPELAHYQTRFPGLDTVDLAPRLQTVSVASPVAHSYPGKSGPSWRAPTPGSIFGGYELLEELGRGGMGLVYKARQPALHRLVALKMILPGTRAEEAELARFRTEAEAIARLRHPNIVQIYEVGEQDGQPFLCLEFCAGGNLAARLKEAALAAPAAAELVETLARATHHAHEQGIIHRDLKPHNILLASTDSTPKITDFGLAKKLDEAGRTATGMVVGTPSYMAPEQAAGKNREVGRATDVYALGAILYECLTGRPPFKAPTALETLLQVAEDDPVPPRLLQARTPRDLETICLKCLHKDPRKRYPCALDLADDLRRFQRGEPIRARPVAAWERAWKWTRRRPVHAALIAALFLAVLGGLAGAGFYARWKDQQAVALRRQLQRQRRLGELEARARELEQGGSPDDAKEQYDRALEMLDAEPEAAPDLRRRLEEGRRRVVSHLEDETRRRQWQESLAAFEVERGVVLAHEISLTEQDRVADQAATRRAASAALAHLGLDESPTEAARKLEAHRQHFTTPAQGQRVVAECYQVCLLWAEAEAGTTERPGDARQALGLLELADTLGQTYGLPVPRAFHLRRARYLAQQGDEVGARGARAQADSVQEETTLDLFLGALDAYHQGQPARAASACTEVLEQEPEHLWAQYLQALCYLRLGHWGEARAGLTACLARQPDLYWARLLRGTASTQLDEFAAAEKDFALVLRHSEEPFVRAVVLTNRSVLWLRRRQWDAAEADLTEAIRLRPEAAEGYANLAQVRRGRQDWEGAVAALDQALARRPGDPLLYHTRAEVQLHRGESAAARHDFEQAIAHEPSSSTSERLAGDHVELAHLQHQGHEYEAALASCEAALRVRPDYPPAQRQLAESLLALERYREAGAALDRYLLAGPPAAEVYQARGIIHSTFHEYPQAVEAYTRALLLRQDPKTLTYRGWIYLRQESASLALADFEAALRLDGQDPEALLGRGHARLRLGQVATAVKDGEAALTGRQSPRLLCDTACLYAQAVGHLAAHPEEGWASAGTRQHYEARAVDLLRTALLHVPEAERGAFWHDRIQNQKDLLPIRRSSGVQELARRYAS